APRRWGRLRARAGWDTLKSVPKLNNCRFRLQFLEGGLGSVLRIVKAAGSAPLPKLLRKWRSAPIHSLGRLQPRRLLVIPGPRIRRIPFVYLTAGRAAHRNRNARK